MHLNPQHFNFLDFEIIFEKTKKFWFSGKAVNVPQLCFPVYIKRNRSGNFLFKRRVAPRCLLVKRISRCHGQFKR